MNNSLLVLQQPSSAILKISLNRPQKKNALNIEILEQLLYQLENIPDYIRGLLLTGEGSSFCTGMDLKECSHPDVAEKSASLLARVFEVIATSSLVTVAAVQGHTLAGGAGLLLACDAAIGTLDTHIAFPETKRGLVASQVMALARYRCSTQWTRNLLLFGEELHGQKAVEIGLLLKVVPIEDLQQTALSLLNQALQGAPEAVRLTKKLLDEGKRSCLHEELQKATALQLQVRLSEEAKEGAAAFLEKRAPRF